MSSVHIDAVGLTPVLSDLVVDGGNDVGNVGPHGGAEHSGQKHGGFGAGILLSS